MTRRQVGTGRLRAGPQLGRASDSLFALYERNATEANESRVQDLNNRFITRMQDVLRTGPGAFHKLEGADAIKAAGATTETLKKFKAEIFGQTANGYQRSRLAPILDTHFASATEQIAWHVDRQQEVYDRNVASTSIAVAEREATSNPDNLAGAVTRAVGAVRVLHKGQPPEVIERESRKAASQIVSSLIRDRLVRNDPSAVGLYRQYEGRLDPTDRATLGTAVETLSNGVEAANWVRERSASLPAPQDRALTPTNSRASALLDEEGVAGHRQRLDAIEDRRRALIALNEQEFAASPARLRANRMAIDTDSAQARAAVNADVNGVYAELRRHLTTAGPNGGPAVTPPPATIMSRLTDAQQDAVTAQVNAAIEGRKPSTDPQTWYAIHQGLMSDDASERQRWASKNLVPFMGRLSGEDFDTLEKLQTAVRSNDGAEQNRLQAITRMANHALRSVGIDPTPQADASPGSHAAQAASFHRALRDELSAFETSKGRKATAAEAYDIVTALKETAIKSGWLEASDRGPTVASDIPLVDDAFHQPGAQLAQAEPSPETGSGRMEMRLDFA
ncbi:MAG: hypothetical protein KIS73_23025, partial [Enhydrobacter sp.]|nr:hypothetical protein [Enhydrobacter sp.]